MPLIVCIDYANGDNRIHPDASLDYEMASTTVLLAKAFNCKVRPAAGDTAAYYELDGLPEHQERALSEVLDCFTVFDVRRT